MNWWKTLQKILWTATPAVLAALMAELGKSNYWWAPIAVAIIARVLKDAARYGGTPK